MSNDSERSLDEIAEELAENGEATITVELGEGGTLESASGLLTGLAELEDVSPSEVEITLRE